jgi:hypothetical protein
MKKIKNLKKSLMLIALLVGVVIIACNKNESITAITPSEVEEQVAFAALQTKLDAYTADFKASIGPIPQRQGFWSWVRKIVQITLADLDGAKTGSTFGNSGAVLGGVLASALKAIDVFSQQGGSGYSGEFINNNIEAEISLSPYLELDNPDNVGYYHNLILSNLFEQNPNFLEGTPEEILAQVQAEMISLGFSQIITVDSVSSVLLENAETIREIISEEFESVELLEEVDTKKVQNVFSKLAERYPDLSNELLLFESFYENAITLDDVLLIEYSEGFTDIVKESQIPKESQNALCAATSTMLASEKLWIAE